MNKTPLHDEHVKLGASMIEFGGWSMPLNYREGITYEHLAVRKVAGLFDISHMGRFIISGKGCLEFLQHILTNNAAALEVGQSHYTILSDEEGSAIDDTYLYRFYPDRFLLVVNASNTEKDKAHLLDISKKFKDVKIEDMTGSLSMLSLQGPKSKGILLSVISSGSLPEPLKNELSIAKIGNVEVLIARTGYTGEPIGFELFLDSKEVADIWTLLISRGSVPVGLGARDTLRLEAGLPLYGHELGVNLQGVRMPVFASPQSRLAVSFSPLKGSYIGRKVLKGQFEALRKILDKDFSSIEALPSMIMQLELIEKGIARPGDRVYFNGDEAGYITSGTVVPYWIPEDAGGWREITGDSAVRSIALALLDSRRWEQDVVEVEVRGKRIKAVIMPYVLRAEAPPHAYPITSKDILEEKEKKAKGANLPEKMEILISKALENTRWRQKECINLIPSEMTPSKVVKMLSIMDPVGRYAEHKKLKAYADLEAFYYQGTDFISHVEELLKDEMKSYLGCSQVETRTISGQMANTAVFSALVDFINRADRKSEPRRIRQVLNHHIIKGGHLSAQPMGALKDFVAIDP
ncbi:MAG: glycine cleavage system aminomethyltransferase GcvT, partial [Actinobacteria bacterium]|nr:glycine cleavage system aminomethyltransferase GcvT [Actinomycetota bacterium]